MPLKKFKLVPIKIYENMVSGNQQMDNCKIDKSTPVDGDDTCNKRNIREIQESNINSKSNMVTSDKEFKKNVTEGGGREHPIFLPDSNTLPQFSKAANIQRSFNNITDILNSDDMTDDLKLKLYNILKSKYDLTREDDNETDDEMDHYDHDKPLIDKRNNFVLQRILTKIPKGVKYDSAINIGDVIVTKNKYISWNRNGKITTPDTDENELDLEEFLKILVYSNKGTNAQIRLVVNIIKPFYKSIERYVKNKQIKRSIDQWHLNAKPSRYVSFD